MQKTSQRGNSIGINLLRFALFLSLTSSPLSVNAADLDLEKDLQNKLSQSKKLVRIVREKQKSGAASTLDGKRLKTLSEDIAASHMLLQERFRVRDEKVKNLGSKARDRQEKVKSGYLKALEEYLSLVNSIPDSGEVSSRIADKLEKLLDRIVHEKKRPIIGSLPYKHLSYPAVLPSATPVIIPAYRNGNQSVATDDTKGTAEAPLSAEIVAKAQSLNWNPVLIYEFVKNNIETEWYWGCMKGAEETLRQKSGNDCDQAALLVALMRASGYPTRYVRGTIEFFPDIEKAKNLTGVSDPAKLGEFFQKAGVPHQVVMDGTVIKNIQIEHLWVETFVPYSNYRGAVMDKQGEIWLALDTSIKAGGYAENQSDDILLSGMSLTAMRDDYLSAVQTGTPLEYLTARINEQLLQTSPTKTYTDYLSTRTLNSDVMQILPSSLQFKEMAITGEYTALPAELIHKATLLAKGLANNELFSITLDMQKLTNRKVIISYEPETVDDQETINTFGGLDNTPAYLVHLRPVLMIDDERIVVGTGGIAMGADYNLSITITSPNGTETFTNSMISGNLTALGVVSQNAVIPIGLDDTKAANLLYREAINYIDNWNKAEVELSSLFKVALSRPLPTIVTLANSIDVTYAGEDPQGFEWKGLFLDADLRSVEAVTRTLIPDSRTLTFMQLSGLQGSVLESKLFEDAFDVGSISTAKLFGIASGSQPATPILTIDQANIDAILPTLPFDDNIKQDISEAVAHNSAIRIPQSEITYQDWAGIGYIKENTTTGEAGYMLSGMVAGGMTALGAVSWSDLNLVAILEAPNYGPVNSNADEAYYIEKVTATDLQLATVDKIMQYPDNSSLMVLVRDITKKPVAGARVEFRISSGGGALVDPGNGELVQTKEVQANELGIASIKMKPGQSTYVNTSFIQRIGDVYPNQVGENIIDAVLKSGRLDTPLPSYFSILAFPDISAQITPWGGSGDRSGAILSYIGTVGAYVKDQHGNPKANVPLNFTAQDPIGAVCAIADQAKLKLQLIEDTVCAKNNPAWGECGQRPDTVTSIKSYSDGSVLLGAILGGLPNATYPVDVYTQGTSTTTFSMLKTNSIPSCSQTSPPDDVLVLDYFNDADSTGTRIDARKTGSLGSISAKSYVLGVRNGVMSVVYPEDLTVKFNNVFSTSHVNGMYNGQLNFPSGPNSVNIDAATGSLTNTLAITIYGVDAQLPPDVFIPVDQYGRAIQDTAISYSIVPTEYRAATAQLAFYKNGSLFDFRYKTLAQGTITETIAHGYSFVPGQTYEMQVVLNYGHGSSEIWSKKVQVKAYGIYLESVDTQYPNSKLRYFDYYPALGGKKITVKGMNLDGTPTTGRKIKAKILAPTNFTINITPEVMLDGAGKTEFTLTADPTLGPVMNSDPLTGTNGIQVQFSLMASDGTTTTQTIQPVWNVKTNANTNLKEVLDGQAVFTYDTASGDNHKGKTTASKDEYRKLDYVQELLNQVVPRMRETYDGSAWVPNQYSLLDENGIYDNVAYAGVKLFKQSFGIEPAASDTYNKIKKDYGLDATDTNSPPLYWFYKIMEKESLVGTALQETDTIPNSEPGNTQMDTGLLELYENVIQRFVNGMIQDGERYLHSNGNDYSGANTSWTSRTGNTVSEAESYCFGCKNTYEQFWKSVTQCTPSAVGQVGSAYAGNVNDSGCGMTGTKKYSGLHSTEINTASQYFAFQSWAGIDCSGFIQRLGTSGKGLDIPGLVCEIPDLIDVDNDNNHIDDGAIGAWQFTEIQRAYWLFDGLSGLKRRGDLLTYGSSAGAISHVAMVYCMKGDDSGLCEDLQEDEYRILHASGSEKVCYGSKKKPDWCTDFNRMTVVNQITRDTRGALKSPLGFGRVKLWD